MTKVINLFGSSGVGKSTTAALLFGNMKLKGIHCELVTEFIKTWAWEGKRVSKMDQLIILGEQIKREKLLYGKVDYIITDSPLLLCGIYEEYFSNKQKIYASEAAQAFLKHAQDNNIEFINFVLERQKSYDTRGRYETEEESNTIQIYIKDYLTKLDIPFSMIETDDQDRAGYILSTLGL